MARKSRRLRRNSEVSMTYGVVPTFEEFSAHLDTARDEDDEPVWDDGGYQMELVGSDVKQAGEALDECEEKYADFHVEEFSGRHGKYGLRFTDKKNLWRFIKALPILNDDQDGDLASSIMTTLEYEWI